LQPIPSRLSPCISGSSSSLFSRPRRWALGEEEVVYVGSNGREVDSLKGRLIAYSELDSERERCQGGTLSVYNLFKPRLGA
jgi:hypothetical protein